MQTNIDPEEFLETMVDKHGFDSIINMLYNICYLKTDHIRSNWQDEETAKAWEAQASHVDNMKVIV